MLKGFFMPSDPERVYSNIMTEITNYISFEPNADNALPPQFSRKKVHSAIAQWIGQDLAKALVAVVPMKRGGIHSNYITTAKSFSISWATITMASKYAQYISRGKAAFSSSIHLTYWI